MEDIQPILSFSLYFLLGRGDNNGMIIREKAFHIPSHHPPGAITFHLAFHPFVDAGNEFDHEVYHSGLAKIPHWKVSQHIHP